MKKFINHLAKYKKDYAVLFIALSLGFTAVMGSHFSDVAKKPFWWHYWAVVQVVSIVAIAATWFFFWGTQNKK